MVRWVPPQSHDHATTLSASGRVLDIMPNHNTTWLAKWTIFSCTNRLESFLGVAIYFVLSWLPTLANTLSPYNAAYTISGYRSRFCQAI